ncbi:MAG: ABC transporter substrate-binding protein [Clostridiales bacterium]|nr:ABC transporter substrate-binding protein [Clostridiales bacterium]
MKKVFLKSQIKIMVLLMVLLLSMVFAGCSNDKENDKDTDKNKQNIETEEDIEDKETENQDTKDQDTEILDDEDHEEVKEKVSINVAALRGPTGMGMVKIMEDAENGNTAGAYKFTVAGEADVISTGLISGDFDIAAVPCNLASVLYNKTEGKISILGINTLGVLYIVETGDSIETVEDLRGKTIYSTGYGTTPQYTLNYLLSANGIDPEKDVTIEYKTEATEVAALLGGSAEGIAMLPQPYVTTVMMNNDKVRVALDINEEWTRQNEDGSGVVTGVVVVNNDFLEKNPEAVEAFMKEYAESASFVNENIDDAAMLIEKHDIFKAAVAKKAIPYCNITFISGQDMKEMVEAYLNVLYNQNPKAVGGEMPADDFYYVN